MDNPESEESKRKAGYYRSSQYCGVCGNPLGSETIRCPEDGKICHNDGQCSMPYRNEELGVEQMLCKFSYEKRLNEDGKKRRDDMIRTAKIILALLMGAGILLLVRKWF